MKKDTTKKFRVARKRTLRTFLLIVTLVAMAFATFNVCKVGGKILLTQFRMGYYYSEIEDLESERASLQQESLGLIGEARRSYQNQADACVERSEALSQARRDLHNSSDPVVAFAAKDYFEVKILLLGLAIFAVFGLILKGIFQHMAEIVIAEENIFSFVVSVGFSMLSALCFILARIFRNCSMIFVPRARKRKVMKKHDSDNNVVKFRSQRRKIS